MERFVIRCISVAVIFIVLLCFAVIADDSQQLTEWGLQGLFSNGRVVKVYYPGHIRWLTVMRPVEVSISGGVIEINGEVFNLVQVYLYDNVGGVWVNVGLVAGLDIDGFPAEFRSSDKLSGDSVE